MKKNLKHLILGSLIIVVLIFVQMLFYKDFNLEKCTIINALYIMSCFAVMIYGFLTSRYYILNQLSFGYTRKEIYSDFLKRSLLSLGYIVLIIMIYLLFDLIIYNHNSFKDFFNFRQLIYFISCYLLFASCGFFQGIFKLKTWISMLIALFLGTSLIVIEIIQIEVWREGKKW